jgi:hypothetical protein
MKRRNSPAYWQLYAFICAMIALGVLIVRAHVSAQWNIFVDTTWAALAIAGMSVWVWANWPALHDEEHEQRTRSKQKRFQVGTSRARNLQLTPVQRRFLDAMRRREPR